MGLEVGQNRPVALPPSGGTGSAESLAATGQRLMEATSKLTGVALGAGDDVATSAAVMTAYRAETTPEGREKILDRLGANLRFLSGDQLDRVVAYAADKAKQGGPYKEMWAGLADRAGQLAARQHAGAPDDPKWVERAFASGTSEAPRAAAPPPDRKVPGDVGAVRRDRARVQGDEVPPPDVRTPAPPDGQLTPEQRGALSRRVANGMSILAGKERMARTGDKYYPAHGFKQNAGMMAKPGVSEAECVFYINQLAERVVKAIRDPKTGRVRPQHLGDPKDPRSNIGQAIREVRDDVVMLRTAKRNAAQDRKLRELVSLLDVMVRVQIRIERLSTPRL